MTSKTQVKRRAKRKTSRTLVETIALANKSPAWNNVAKRLSGSTRRQSSVNLQTIDDKSKEGDTIVVLGRVLGSGNISKKVKICALGFSAEAREKAKHVKCELVSVYDEIKSNSKAHGVTIL